MAVLLLATLSGSAGSAQTTAPADAEAIPLRAGEGRIAGRVVDADSGAGVSGVTVMLTFPTSSGDEPRQDFRTTDSDGVYVFASVPAGRYRIDFTKTGHRASSLADFQVSAGVENRADLALEPQAEADAPATDVPTDPSDVEIYVVQSEQGDELLGAIERRLQSDQVVNVLGAEDISKFAAVDMADALKRVSGVNVVEGQFAIIRGLEDRYSSTLFNGAPIPSPDPDRQSPQLDLFPAEVVDRTVIAKTFSPELPSNSSGGSIDIGTAGQLEDFEAKVKVKGGLNDNAVDRFLRLSDGNPVGVEESGLDDTFAREGGAFLGGRKEVKGHELRFEALGNWEVDYGTEVGFQEDREPRTRIAAPPDGELVHGVLGLTEGRFDLTTSERSDQRTGFGGLGFDIDELGDHTVDVSLFWTRKDQETVQLKENGYFPGFDYLAPGGPVERQINGDPEITFSNAFDGTVANPPGNAALSTWIVGDSRDQDEATRGPLWLSSFLESKSFHTERDLLVPQINGNHNLDVWVPGLEVHWVANWAKTTQKDAAYGARMWYEPCGYAGNPRLQCPEGVARIPVPTVFPVTVQSLGPGAFISRSDGLFANLNDVEETQWFGRLDGEYEAIPADWVVLELKVGGWIERGERDVSSTFLGNLETSLNPACPQPFVCEGPPSGTFNAVYGNTAKELGATLFGLAFPLALQPTKDTRSKAEREIEALALGAKTTFWDDLDLLGGVRLENISITTDNDPFVTDANGASLELDRSPLIYPTKFLFLDRFGDNPIREAFTRVPPFNDQVLGVPVQAGPCRGPNGPNGEPPPPDPVAPGTCVDLATRQEIEAAVDGEIDEALVLPSASIAYRPLRGLALRGAYSQTVARPSFRELGYYASVEPASDDVIIGNPQLQLSDVESWDARAEYVHGPFADLVAVSGFYKTIEDPIESIIVRNPIDFQSSLSQGLFRTFFNNPNEATVLGLEFEARKSLGFLDLGYFGGRDLEWLDYLSVGGNFTWIDAEVDRTDAELQRAERFFPAGSEETLEKSRRLFGQPEWIANADVSLDHPVWGTKVTLGYYAISDVLDAAGAATIGRNGEVVAITLDRYIDSFHTLDFVLSQKLWGGLALKFSAKNLTDSRRQIVYDPAEVSGDIPERSYRVGRDYSLELSYTFSKLPDFGLSFLRRPE